MDHRRSKRIGGEIREIVSELVRSGLKQPGLPPLLTITEVEVTPDLSLATIFFSQIPDADDEVARTQKALDRAKGFIRTEIVSRIRMKYHPEIRFRHDKSAQNYARIDAALKKAAETASKPDESPAPE